MATQSLKLSHGNSARCVHLGRPGGDPLVGELADGGPEGLLLIGEGDRLHVSILSRIPRYLVGRPRKMAAGVASGSTLNRSE